MYYWRINSLKQELSSPMVSDNDVLPYVLWTGSLGLLTAWTPYAELNWWDLAVVLFGLGMFLGGTRYAFLCNGGAAGRQFLLRYVAVSWVLSVRFFVLAGVPGVVALSLLEALLLEPASTDPGSTGISPLGAIFMIALGACFYWRLATHIRDVAGALPNA